MTKTARRKRAEKTDSSHDLGSSGYCELIICFALFALTFLLFGRCISYPFINYDDPSYILERPQITAGVTFHGIAWSLTHAHGGNWHPLTSLSHMLDCQLFGLSASGPHFVNILLHSTTSALLFWFLLKLTRTVWCSVFVAILFAIHPLRVESVVWVAERKDVLSGLLFVLTLGSYIAYARTRTVALYIVSVVFFALGLLAKPMLVSVPVILLLIDYWMTTSFPPQKSDSRKACPIALTRTVIEKLPFILLAAMSCIATILAQKGAISSVEALPIADRAGNAALSYFVYLRQIFWPTGLALFYPLGEEGVPLLAAILAAVSLFTMTIFAFYCRRRAPFVFVGWCWFVIMLLPVIGLVQVGLQSHADRYSYLPQIGINIMVVWSLARLAQSRPAVRLPVAAVGVLVIFLLITATWRQSYYWRDSEFLWQRSLTVNPRNHFAHAYLADLLLRQDRFEESIGHSEEALRILPTNSDAHNNLALALFRTGHLREAVTHWRQSLEIAPHNRNAEANYAWVLSTATDPSVLDGAAALQLMEDVISDNGRDNPMILRGLGAAYAQSGRFTDAIAAAEEAMQIAKLQQNAALMEDLRLNIENYRASRPLRDAGVMAPR